MKKSLMGRLMAANLVIIGVTIIALGLMLLGLLGQYIRSSREADLVAKGREISRVTSEYLSGELDERTAVLLLDSLDRIVGARVWVVNKRGLIVLESRPNRFRGTYLDAEEVLHQVMKGETVSKTGVVRFGEPTLTVAVPVQPTPNREVMGAIFLHAPLTGLKATLARFCRFIVFAGVSSLAVATILGYALAKGISSPLVEMNAAARRMADGDLEIRVKVKGEDEAGELARSLNHMASNLRSTIDDLEREKARFLSMVSSMEEGVIGIDSRGLPVFFNEAAKRLLGGTHLDPAIDLLLQEVLEKREPSAISLKTEDKWLRVQGSPIGAVGQASGAVVVLQDVSEAARLERMRREFMANVSHELRTPLTAIRGFVEPLLDGTTTDEETRQRYLGIIRAETERLGRLVKDIMDMGRLDEGRRQLEITPFSLGEVVRIAVAKVRPRAEEKGIGIRSEVPEVAVEADRERIEQVLLNLLDNAIRFTPKGGGIRLHAQESEDSIWVRVSDTGVGINPEDLPFVWERFYKTDRSRGDKIGTGLGLALVRQIVKAHGGELGVESEPGRGSTFSFSLRRCGGGNGEA